MRYGFILAEKANYPVDLMCRLLEVSPSGFYEWVAGRESLTQREAQDLRLVTKLMLQHQIHLRSYGSRRHAAELPGIGRHRTRRLMKKAGLRAKQPRRYRITTKSDHDHPIADNLLNRDFRPSGPNQSWVGDLTYLRTHEGWLYLVVVLDLFSRKVVGWSMSERPTRHVVLNAFRMAVNRRGVTPGLIFHSDRGSQYASKDHRRALKVCGVLSSMSRRANCWDNAVAESFFATLKKELIVEVDNLDRETVRQAVFNYLETYYNKKRRHSTLGYQTPQEYENQSQNRKEHPAA